MDIFKNCEMLNINRINSDSGLGLWNLTMIYCLLSGKKKTSFLVFNKYSIYFEICIIVYFLNFSCDVYPINLLTSLHNAFLNAVFE